MLFQVLSGTQISNQTVVCPDTSELHLNHFAGLSSPKICLFKSRKLDGESKKSLAKLDWPNPLHHHYYPIPNSTCSFAWSCSLGHKNESIFDQKFLALSCRETHVLLHISVREGILPLTTSRPMTLRQWRLNVPSLYWIFHSHGLLFIDSENVNLCLRSCDTGKLVSVVLKWPRESPPCIPKALE